MVKVVSCKVPNVIVKARASYQLQRGVPSDCQAQTGKKTWKEGAVRTLNEATSRVPAFIARTDLEILEAGGDQLTVGQLVRQYPRSCVSVAVCQLLPIGGDFRPKS